MGTEGIDGELRHLQKLISFKTVLGNPDEYVKAAEYLKSELRRLGCSVEVVDAYREGKVDSPRPNVVGYMDFGKKDTIILNAHYDVVPEGDGWHTDPFRMVVKGGVAYGRGSGDDKGPLAVILGVLEELRKRGEAKYNIMPIFVCDEELGGQYGSSYVMSKGLKRKAALAIVIDMRRLAILGTCGVVSGTIRVYGKQVHASQEWLGRSAIVDGMRLLGLMNGFKKVRARHTSKLIIPGTDRRIFGRFNITVINSGYASNVIPALLEAKFDMRIVPGEDKDEAIRELREYFGKAVKKSGVRGKLEIAVAANGYLTDPKNRFVREFIESSGFKKSYGAPAADDGRIFHSHGITTVSSGIEITSMAHRTDEGVKLSDIAEGKRMLLKFLSA